MSGPRDQAVLAFRDGQIDRATALAVMAVVDALVELDRTLLAILDHLEES